MRSTHATGEMGQPAGAGSSAILLARHLTRVFRAGDGAVFAVNSAELEVHAGDFLVVMGRSGSGKTTLLNLMAGLDRPTSGSVIFQGLDLNTLSDARLVELRRHKMGFVFQSFGLVPLLSAYENVELALHISGVPWVERRRRAQETLELVGLGPRAKHRPYEMSGGEQQRVAIARALVNRPHVVFADEPTGELDTATAMSVAAILKEIALQRGVTVIAATHDPILARMGTRTVEMVDGNLTELASSDAPGMAPHHSAST